MQNIRNNSTDAYTETKHRSKQTNIINNKLQTCTLTLVNTLGACSDPLSTSYVQ